jgi:6-phosphofructokinase 1
MEHRQRSTRYAIARRYMIRLRRDDFDDPHELAKLAATAHMPLENFRQQFEYSDRIRAASIGDRRQRGGASREQVTWEPSS